MCIFILKLICYMLGDGWVFMGFWLKKWNWSTKFNWWSSYYRGSWGSNNEWKINHWNYGELANEDPGLSMDKNNNEEFMNLDSEKQNRHVNEKDKENLNEDLVPLKIDDSIYLRRD